MENLLVDEMLAYITKGGQVKTLDGKLLSFDRVMLRGGDNHLEIVYQTGMSRIADWIPYSDADEINQLRAKIEAQDKTIEAQDKTIEELEAKSYNTKTYLTEKEVASVEARFEKDIALHTVTDLEALADIYSVSMPTMRKIYEGTHRFSSDDYREIPNNGLYNENL